MICSKCGAQLEDDARFCNVCGEKQLVSSAPVYGQSPQEPAYAPPPVYEQPPQAPPQEPAYALPPVYEQPKQTPPQEPVYAPPPVYEQPTQTPPQEPAYAPPPVYEQPKQTPPQEPAYAPPGYQPPYGAPPQGAYYPANQSAAYQGGGTPPPEKKGGKKKLLMILIPVAAVVVVALVLFLLELFNVIDIIPSFPDNGSASTLSDYDWDRDRPNRGNEEDDDNRRGSEDDNGNSGFTTPTAPALPTDDDPFGGPGITSGDITTFHVGEVTVTYFTPNRSGVWVFETSNNIDCDPVLYLYDSSGNQVAHDDDGGEGSNAAMGVFLNQGETYSISSQFYGSFGGGYTVTVSPAQTMSGNGGSVRVDTHMWFAFIPNDTGLWEMFTSDNQNCDPVLYLYNLDNEQIAYDDDSAGDLNAQIRTGLIAGNVYIIKAGSYSSGNGGYTLNVAFRQSGGELSGDGGEVLVVGMEILTFVPNESLIWALYSSDNSDCDPVLTIYNASNSVYVFDDDSGDGYNAFIALYLEAGESYTIEAGSFGNSATYVLNVAPATLLPLGERTLNVDRMTAFVIQADQSREWVFETSNNVTDPLLRLCDMYGNQIAVDDDGGEGSNARLSYRLEAGTVYTILATCYGSWGRYDLTISRG